MNDLYQSKYTKYKTKYLNIKKQIGGNIITTLDFGEFLENCNIPIEQFYFYGFNTKVPSTIIQVVMKINDENFNKEIDNPIKKYTYENNKVFTFELISIENKNKYELDYKISFDEYNDYIIHFIFKDKLRVVLTKQYKINFIEKLLLITKKSDINYKKFYLNDFDTNINFSGTFQLNNLELELIFTKINENIINNLDLEQNIILVEKIKNKKNYSDLFENNQEVFNFEKFYDEKIKTLNLCIQSNNLAKNFASSFINMIYIKNDYIKILASKYSLLLEKLLISILTNNKNIIDKNCSNSIDRKFLLTNILKKLNTFIEDQVKIEAIINHNSEYKNIDELNKIYRLRHDNAHGNLKIILDTGNSSTTIIGRGFAEVLGLPYEKSFNTKMSGVVKSVSTTLNEKINIKLKFNDDNIDINKIYNIETYISDSFHDNILLIGNFSDGLANIFSSSYCISYENNPKKYNLEKIKIQFNFNEIKLNIEKLLEWYKKKEYVRLTSTSITYINLINEIIQQLDNIMIIKKYYTNDETKSKFDEIYNLFRELKKENKLVIDNNDAYILFNKYLNSLNSTLDKYISSSQ
jgi:hypothetical protein